jgi:plasmid stability protein
MKNITVTVDDDLYRRARIRAAEEGTTVSAVVKGIIREFAEKESEFERLARMEREMRAELFASGRGVRAADRMTREEVHERRRGGKWSADQAA